MTDSLLEPDTVIFDSTSGDLYLIRGIIGKVNGIVPRVFIWGDYSHTKVVD